MHLFSTLFTAQSVDRDLRTEEGLQRCIAWCKESKLQKALEAALKMVNELKTKVTALTAELAEYKSVRGQLRTVDLEKENGELRGKLRKYEDVISRHNLWSYFSQHRRSEIDRGESR